MRWIWSMGCKLPSSQLCAAEKGAASAGNAYWNLATTRAINTWVSPLILSLCLRSWFKRYKRWFIILIVYLTCNYIDSLRVNKIHSLASTHSICIKGGGGMYGGTQRWSHKHDLFSFGAISDKLINFCPSNSMTELVYKIRGRVLRAELRWINSVFTQEIYLTDRL